MVMVPEQTAFFCIDCQVSEFKTALQKILTDDTLTPETQMQLYNQLFTRYLKLDADLKEPATVIKKNEESDTLDCNLF